MDRLLELQIPRLIESLGEQGWVELTEAFSRRQCQQLLATLEERYVDGRFREARIGQGSNEVLRADIRSDTIEWIEKDDPQISVQTWLKEVDELRCLLNEAFFLSTETYECHFSCYEIGGAYQKHYDRIRGKSTRVLSIILFLNENWQDEDDGRLLIYESKDPKKLAATIKPELGTLLIFDSDKIPHEVQVTKRRRLSLTGWLTRTNPKGLI